MLLEKSTWTFLNGFFFFGVLGKALVNTEKVLKICKFFPLKLFYQLKDFLDGHLKVIVKALLGFC